MMCMGLSTVLLHCEEAAAVERMQYSLPYTYHLLDMERNNCWIKDRTMSGQRLAESLIEAFS